MAGALGSRERPGKKGGNMTRLGNGDRRGVHWWNLGSEKGNA